MQHGTCRGSVKPRGCIYRYTSSRDHYRGKPIIHHGSLYDMCPGTIVNQHKGYVAKHVRQCYRLTSR